MVRFLILEADHPCGRGARGLNLHRFLSRYHGGRAVRLVSTSELLASPRQEAEVLFIGLPSRLTPAHLARVRYRRAVLFDYQDQAGPCWGDSDEVLLRSITRRYLKPWVEGPWDFGLRFGVLPLRRHFRLRLCVQTRAAWRALAGEREDRRDVDVVFVGAPTAYQDRLHQRTEWWREVKDAGDRYSAWGGLVLRPAQREGFEDARANRPDLFLPQGRVDFLTYFRHLSRARVALAPSGNARWSYRHYEALYAGAVVVSTDLRSVRTLIPLPLEHLVQVPDGASVLPAIDQALALRARHPELPAENLRFLEQYLHHSDYSRKKPALMDLFLEQLHD